jgi:hypothetical protein
MLSEKKSCARATVMPKPIQREFGPLLGLCLLILPWLFLPWWLLPLLFALILPLLFFLTFRRDCGRLKRKVTIGLTGLKANPFTVESRYEVPPEWPKRREIGPLVGLCTIMLPWLFWLFGTPVCLVVIVNLFVLRLSISFADHLPAIRFQLKHASARKVVGC